MNKSIVKKLKTALEAGCKKVEDSYTKNLDGWDATVAKDKAHKAWRRSLAKYGIRMEPIDVIIGIETLQQTIEIANANPEHILVMDYTNQQFKDEMDASSEGEGKEECVFVYIIPKDLSFDCLPFDPPVKKKAKARSSK
jgi:hypothetical protein